MPSAAATPGAPTVVTFPYTSTDDGPLYLDIHRSGTTDDGGVVVYVHGGGFVVGDRGTDHGRVRALADHGVTVVVPDYRKAPGTSFPDPVDDVRAAVRWVRANGDLVGVGDPRVALWGASAGAVLAALVALSDPSAAGGRIAAVVWWFGFSDIASSASRSPLEADILPPGPARALLGVDDLSTAPDLVRAASPISHVHPDGPPFLISHGDRDHVVEPDESRRLHEAMVRVGGTSTLITVGGAGHEDPRFDTDANLALTAAFLRSHLDSRPATADQRAPTTRSTTGETTEDGPHE
jgi:acetyl esterase/lipase